MSTPFQSVWSSVAQLDGVANPETNLAFPSVVMLHYSGRYDPSSGYVIERRYKGTPDDILGLWVLYIGNNWQAEYHSDGSPYLELNVSTPNANTGTDADTFDRWEFDIAFKQQDLFANLGVIAILGTAGITGTAIATEKTVLKNQLDAGVTWDSLSGVEGITSQELTIYEMMVRGQEFVEVAQPVLTRKRVYDSQFSGSQLANGGTIPANVFWSASALVEAFGIPGDIAGLLINITDPSLAVEGYEFGWKLRKNNLVIIPAKNKIEETVDWEFDQWSTTAYQYNG
jgi:hypothetical protein